MAGPCMRPACTPAGLGWDLELEEGPALSAGCPGPAAGWGEVALAMPVRLACTPAGLGWDLDMREGPALSAGCPGPAAGWGEVAMARHACTPAGLG